MRIITPSLIAALILCSALPATAQGTPKVLVMVVAHGDDEGAAAPVLARYARQGAQVYLVVVTDGAQGGARTTIPRGPELARARETEARCAATALGINPPIILGFPDGALGNYIGDASLLYRLAPRLAEELQRLRPDVLVTWGPDGGTGHPDHRLVSTIVTQLVYAGAPGVPERLFYAYLGGATFRPLNPGRGSTPFLIPQEKHFTTRISYTPADFEAAARSAACHQTQYPPELVQTIVTSQKAVWNGVVPFVPAFATGAGTDLFAPSR